MYSPKQFEHNDSAALQALIRERPFATWVLHHDGELIVNHLPFLYEHDRGAHGTLCCHVARANPVWQTVADATSASVVVFHGVHHYVTPAWYPAKREHGKVVPTWNYAVVHAHGVAEVVADGERLRRHVSLLTGEHEATQEQPWQITDAPDGFIDNMLRGIVGIEIPVTRLIGKWKLSQNRTDNDQRGVVAGLKRCSDEDAAAMAELMGRGFDVGEP